MEAYREVQQLRDTIKTYGAADAWAPAAECFADYWGGAGTWAMDDQRRAAFAKALKPNYHEWDAIMNEMTTLVDWSDKLPSDTTVVYDPNTVRPIIELVELCERETQWEVAALPKGGHMAPLTHPEVVNPIILGALRYSLE